MEALTGARSRLRYMRRAVIDAPDADNTLLADIDGLEAELAQLRVRLQGDRPRARRQEPIPPSIMRRAADVGSGHWDSRQAPTTTQRRALEIAQSELDEFLGDLKRALEVRLPELEAALEAAGAPWTPGRALPD